eukprot:gene3897-14410_t
MDAFTRDEDGKYGYVEEAVRTPDEDGALAWRHLVITSWVGQWVDISRFNIGREFPDHEMPFDDIGEAAALSMPRKRDRAMCKDPHFESTQKWILTSKRIYNRPDTRDFNHYAPDAPSISKYF